MIAEGELGIELVSPIDEMKLHTGGWDEDVLKEMFCCTDAQGRGTPSEDRCLLGCGGTRMKIAGSIGQQGVTVLRLTNAKAAQGAAIPAIAGSAAANAPG